MRRGSYHFWRTLKLTIRPNRTGVLFIVANAILAHEKWRLVVEDVARAEGEARHRAGSGATEPQIVAG